MSKKSNALLIFSLVLIILVNSGCIDNSKANSTWGEKKISLDAIKISNNTTGNHSENNQFKYYVYGYVENGNPFEAVNPKIKVSTFSANGTLVAVNETPHIDPKNIPANGRSYFYALFTDPDKKISTFNVEIMEAKGEYWT